MPCAHTSHMRLTLWVTRPVHRRSRNGSYNRQPHLAASPLQRPLVSLNGSVRSILNLPPPAPEIPAQWASTCEPQSYSRSACPFGNLRCHALLRFPAATQGVVQMPKITVQQALLHAICSSLSACVGQPLRRLQAEYAAQLKPDYSDERALTESGSSCRPCGIGNTESSKATS